MEKLGDLIHLFVTVFISTFAGLIVIPAITDVTMSAVCPGQDECSLAIYLSGFQTAITGVGSIVMQPVIGNLSDKYGRKALLTLPMTLPIIPLVILAYSRSTNSFYAYYVINTLTSMVCNGSAYSLSFAYVADIVSERQRASAFGILSGVAITAFVCSTLVARFLSAALTFQVAAFASMFAIVYMRIFLKESLPDRENLTHPLLNGAPNHDNQDDTELPRKFTESKKIPSVGDIICLLKTSPTFSQAAVVAFFNSLADVGKQSTTMYYLKARFHFNKNQYAELMLIGGIAGMISQLFFMPLLAPYISEEKLLALGLLVGCINNFLNGIAWSVWVPYATSVLGVFVDFIAPSLRSIVSKQVGPDEQGKAQGCISSITSLANVISPLIFSPLTALFLSEEAPFNFPGFSIMCIGFVTMIAFIQSTMIRAAPTISAHKISSNDIEA